jgi:hypothetical protein
MERLMGKRNSSRTPQNVFLEMQRRNSVHAYLIQAVFMLAARDFMGYGHDRLMKFYSHAKFYFEQVNDGNVVLKDLLVALQDECDIAIGPSGLKSLRGQKAPIDKEGVVTFKEDDKTDDSKTYHDNNVKVKSDTLRTKLGNTANRRL